jgi:hypothetical protein
MSCTETLKAHVSPDVKLQAKVVADREFLSEAAWLKRLVLREIRACDGARGGERERCQPEGVRRSGSEASGHGYGKPVLVRLRAEDGRRRVGCARQPTSPS